MVEGPFEVRHTLVDLDVERTEESEGRCGCLSWFWAYGDS